MRSFTSKREHGIAGVFIFLILAMFLLGSTLLVVMGARVYRGTNERSAAHSEARVLCAYLRSAVRGDDAEGTIGVREEDGTQYLCFTNSYDGDLYERRLYCADGYLRESFAAVEEEADDEDGIEEFEEESFDADFADFDDDDEAEDGAGDPWGGETVCAARDVRFELNDRLLTAVVTDASGDVHTLYMALRTA